jgi:hypothetical protein
MTLGQRDELEASDNLWPPLRRDFRHNWKQWPLVQRTALNDNT